jgi:hypothetical protein
MSPPPAWALAITYWLHLLATVAWIGAIVATSILFLPAASKALKPVDHLALIGAMQKRLEPIAWFCRYRDPGQVVGHCPGNADRDDLADLAACPR